MIIRSGFFSGPFGTVVDWSGGFMMCRFITHAKHMGSVCAALKTPAHDGHFEMRSNQVASSETCQHNTMPHVIARSGGFKGWRRTGETKCDRVRQSETR